MPLKDKNYYRFVFVVASILFLVSCLKKPPTEYEPNDIDLSPILEIDLPIEAEDDMAEIIHYDSIDKLQHISIPQGGFNSTHSLSLSYIIQSEPDDEVTFNIHMGLYPSIEAASIAVQEDCADRSGYRLLHTKGEGEIDGIPYSYCVYAFKLNRSDANSFWVSLGYYTSATYIQKGNLRLRITERTETLDRTLSNDAIKQLAELMKTP